MTERIVVLNDATHELVDRLRAVRAAGDIPLVDDGRRPQAQREAVHALVRDARPPTGAAWASLTSGSSGTPRVVLRTAASWEESFPAVSALLHDPRVPDAERVVALPAPASSSLTLFSLAHALSGGPRPVFPGQDPGHDGDLADATAFHGTPQALRAMLDGGQLPRVRTALVGGSHLDQDLRAQVESRGIRVISYYGAAELSFVAVDDGTGLRPFPGVDLDVRGGELWVRSPFVALGYLGAGGPLRTDGSWATVGDLAELDADADACPDADAGSGSGSGTGTATGTGTGTLRLRGRADGAIITASATVIPEEVEAELRRVPAIADAVVFGLPAGNVGALVAAMLEPAPGFPTITTGSLRSLTSPRLGPAHRPRVWFTGELPRNASGKPARAEIVRRALAGEVTRVAG